MIQSKNYTIGTTLSPVILTLPPVLVFTEKLINLYLSNFILSMSIVLSSLCAFILFIILIYLLMQINQLTGKFLQQKFLKREEMKIPSSNQLLWKNSLLDNSLKENIRFKIHQMFDIKLMSKEEEIANEAISKKQIENAITQIKKVLSINRLSLNENARYKFFWNFLGGCFTACLVSFALLMLSYIQKDESIKTTALIFLIIYLMPFSLRKFLEQVSVNHFSRTVYQQFLSLWQNIFRFKLSRL